MSDSVFQVWRCNDCNAPRIWGASVCEDPNRLVYLFCELCRGMKLHHFLRHKFGAQNKLAS
jgi:hypothetical protein